MAGSALLGVNFLLCEKDILFLEKNMGAYGFSVGAASPVEGTVYSMLKEQVELEMPNYDLSFKKNAANFLNIWNSKLSLREKVLVLSQSYSLKKPLEMANECGENFGGFKEFFKINGNKVDYSSLDKELNGSNKAKLQENVSKKELAIAFTVNAIKGGLIGKGEYLVVPVNSDNKNSRDKLIGQVLNMLIGTTDSLKRLQEVGLQGFDLLDLLIGAKFFKNREAFIDAMKNKEAIDAGFVQYSEKFGRMPRGSAIVILSEMINNQNHSFLKHTTEANYYPMVDDFLRTIPACMYCPAFGVVHPSETYIDQMVSFLNKIDGFADFIGAEKPKQQDNHQQQKPQDEKQPEENPNEKRDANVSKMEKLFEGINKDEHIKGNVELAITSMGITKEIDFENHSEGFAKLMSLAKFYSKDTEYSRKVMSSIYKHLIKKFPKKADEITKVLCYASAHTGGDTKTKNMFLEEIDKMSNEEKNKCCFGSKKVDINTIKNPKWAEGLAADNEAISRLMQEFKKVEQQELIKRDDQFLIPLLKEQKDILKELKANIANKDQKGIDEAKSIAKKRYLAMISAVNEACKKYGIQCQKIASVLPYLAIFEGQFSDINEKANYINNLKKDKRLEYHFTKIVNNIIKESNPSNQQNQEKDFEENEEQDEMQQNEDQKQTENRDFENSNEELNGERSLTAVKPKKDKEKKAKLKTQKSPKENRDGATVVQKTTIIEKRSKEKETNNNTIIEKTTKEKETTTWISNGFYSIMNIISFPFRFILEFLGILNKSETSASQTPPSEQTPAPAPAATATPEQNSDNQDEEDEEDEEKNEENPTVKTTQIVAKKDTKINDSPKNKNVAAKAINNDNLTDEITIVEA